MHEAGVKIGAKTVYDFEFRSEEMSYTSVEALTSPSHFRHARV